LITQQQTEEKELTMNKSPRALALEAHPFDPACLTVAGDATTPNGQRYVDSFLNDYRNPNMVAWSPAHEALVLSLVQTARPSGSVNVPVGEPDGVVLMTKVVDFFGGELDYNDSDDSECDYSVPEKTVDENSPQDGEAWYNFQNRVLNIKPLTKEEWEAADKHAAYKIGE
jgi:hypothetical protein